MRSSQTSRRLGTALRIYRNVINKIIAIDDIEVVVDNFQKTDFTFFRSVNAVHVKRTIFHLTTGDSRDVAIIQTIGDYSSIEENGGNYLVVTWNKCSNEENDVILSLEDKVAVIGDTI